MNKVYENSFSNKGADLWVWFKCVFLRSVFVYLLSSARPAFTTFLLSLPWKETANTVICSAKEYNVFFAHQEDSQQQLLQAWRAEFICEQPKNERVCQCQNYLLKELKRAFFLFLYQERGASKLVVRTLPDSPGSRKYGLCQVWPEFLDTCQMAPFLWKLKLNHSRIQTTIYNFSSWAFPDLLSCRLAQQGTWPLRF